MKAASMLHATFLVATTLVHCIPMQAEDKKYKLDFVAVSDESVAPLRDAQFVVVLHPGDKDGAVVAQVPRRLVPGDVTAAVWRFDKPFSNHFLVDSNRMISGKNATGFIKSLEPSEAAQFGTLTMVTGDETRKIGFLLKVVNSATELKSFSYKFRRAYNGRATRLHAIGPRCIPAIGEKWEAARRARNSKNQATYFMLENLESKLKLQIAMARNSNPGEPQKAIEAGRKVLIDFQNTNPLPRMLTAREKAIICIPKNVLEWAPEGATRDEAYDLWRKQEYELLDQYRKDLKKSSEEK